MNTKVRIGIDVGGTFTDAVVIDDSTHEVIAKAKIPTTHDSELGVAEGIVTAINKLMDENHISPEDVVFIAHGTTQATNALLEGDVAKVGIVGMGTGIEGKRARTETQVGNIELAPGRFLHTEHRFIDSANASDEQITGAIRELKQAGAQVIVASEAYSVDDPTNEKRIVQLANKESLPATGGYEISQLYGLLARTRTASVNGALIPKMMETANLTQNSVSKANIHKPLMIMRCDGGVMSVDEMRKRPILTMLSGLAAGVAGALMYEKVTDGIFLEIGGTSIDISVIKDGRVMIKNAQVGGNNLYLSSLDVRTLGIAGGSMLMVKNNTLSDVGPRSAHIAGLPYEVFTDTAEIEEPHVELIAPCHDDPAVYVSVACKNGKRFALTLAGAANILGYVPEDDYAAGNTEAARLAWQPLADLLGLSIEETCTKAMDLACEKVSRLVSQLIEDYHLNRSLIYLVGGGGSASVITPYLGKKMGMNTRIAKNAPYISTIGVAMAMVTERLERNIVNPTPDDIRRIRNDVTEMVVRAGANPDTVEVAVEIDSQKNILRAVANGSTELRTKNLKAEKLTSEQLKEVAIQSVSGNNISAKELAHVGAWHAFAVTQTKAALFGLLKKKTTLIRIIDEDGVIRLQKDKADVLTTTKGALAAQMPDFVDSMTTYNDGGAMLPQCYLYVRHKQIDLSGVMEKENLMSLAALELEFIEDDEPVLVVASKN